MHIPTPFLWSKARHLANSIKSFQSQIRLRDYSYSAFSVSHKSFILV